MTWRPISSAPFEMVSPSGRPEDADPWLDWCLLWVPDEHGGVEIVGGMDAGMWLERDADRCCGELERAPTYWMPLPAKPLTDALWLSQPKTTV